MKEKLTLRNVILWGVASVLLVLFVVTFGATAKFKGSVEGDSIVLTMRGAIWGITSISGYGGGSYFTESVDAAWRAASVPGIIGAILLLLSAGGLVLVSFLVKDEKTKKILAIVCAGVILVASVLMFFVGEVAWKQLQKELEYGEHISVTIDQLKQIYSGVKASSGTGIFIGIAGILLSAGIVVTQLVVKDIKFIKSK